MLWNQGISFQSRLGSMKDYTTYERDTRARQKEPYTDRTRCSLRTVNGVRHLVLGHLRRVFGLELLAHVLKRSQAAISIHAD